MEPIYLKKKYNSEVRLKMTEMFGYKNPNEVPKLIKIVINRGIGEALSNSKAVENSVEEFSLITGQKPIVTKAKKSIAGFKLREGLAIGCMVTLRGQRMYDFLSKLISLSLPKVRDFRGIPNKSFDGRGNYSMGIREQLIFPEINFDKVDKVRGMDVTICTTAKTDDESRALLTFLGMPLRK